VDAIVEAAAHLLASRGWEGSSTNHIAERAGVSIGSLYKYFPNKPSIVAEVARRRINQEMVAIETVFAQHPAAPRRGLERMVSDMVERYAQHAALDTALLEQLGPIEAASFLRAAEAHVVEMTAAYLDRHAGALRVHDWTAAFVVTHTLRGLLVAAAAHRPQLLRDERLPAEIFRMLECYLFP
jgi:AcrR family transcriptional regulator